MDSSQLLYVIRNIIYEYQNAMLVSGDVYPGFSASAWENLSLFVVTFYAD